MSVVNGHGSGLCDAKSVMQAALVHMIRVRKLWHDCYICFRYIYECYRGFRRWDTGLGLTAFYCSNMPRY